MKETIYAADRRAEELGRFIVEHKATVRTAAAATGVSKSTVHKEVNQRLKETDYGLYLQVREILDLNKSERHIRGGIATREKYRKMARQSADTSETDVSDG